MNNNINIDINKVLEKYEIIATSTNRQLIMLTIASEEKDEMIKSLEEKVAELQALIDANVKNK